MNTADLLRQQIERVKQSAPFLQCPEAFIYFGAGQLKPLRSTSHSERVLLKANGYQWNRTGVWVRR